MFYLSQLCLLLFFISITLALLFVLLWRCSRKLQSNRFPIHDYKISSSPNVWVFDDLISEELLDYVDREFERKEFSDGGEKGPDFTGSNQLRKELTLELNSRTEEFNQIIEKIGNFIPHETCKRFLVSDVSGENQLPHMDHIDIDSLAPEYQKLGLIDKSTLEEGKSRVHSASESSSGGSGRFVPTFSIVIYFNDVGSCNFPKANLNVKGKRGRIIMFQNYISDERPNSDHMAAHQGTYGEGKFKRVMTMGILSNKNIDLDTRPETKGILYVPNGHHGWGGPREYPSRSPSPKRRPPPKAAYGPKTFFIIQGSCHGFGDNCTFELKVSSKEYRSYQDEWVYRVEYTKTFSNSFYNTFQALEPFQFSETRINRASKTCGNVEDEIVTYMVLTSQLRVHPSISRGWVCRCHLCNREFDKRKEELERILQHFRDLKIKAVKEEAEKKRLEKLERVRGKSTKKKHKEGLTFKRCKEILNGTYRNADTGKKFDLWYDFSWAASDLAFKGQASSSGKRLWNFKLKGRTIEVEGKDITGKVYMDGSIRWSNGKQWVMVG